MNLHIGKFNMVVKPAMVVLVGALVTAAVAVPVLQRAAAPHVETFGYANPNTWRFETRQGAQATADGDMGRNFTVHVTQKGTGADSVYLRNAFNLDLNREKKRLHLQFETRAVNAADPKAEASAPFPVTFTVRANKTLLWSKHVNAGPRWQAYDETVDLSKSDSLSLILAAHMGEAEGDVQIRNLRLVDTIW